MIGIRRMFITLLVVAGVLALLGLALVVPTAWQLIANSDSARSPGGLVPGLVFLLGALVFGGVALSLRGVKPPAHTQAIAEGRVDVQTAKQAMVAQASHPAQASRAAAQPAGADHPDDELVTEEKWARGQAVYRSKVKITGNLPPDEDLAALAGMPGLAPRRESAPPNVLVQKDLTVTLARANELDLDALTVNRTGRLSPTQISAALGSIAVELLFYAGIIALIVAVAAAFSAGNSHNPAGLVVPCGLAVALVVAISVTYVAKQRMGADRYDNRPLALALVIPDLVLGRVQSVEGMTSREKEVRHERLRASDRVDGGTAAQTIYRYWYSVGGEQIIVGEKGYLAFPEQPLKCRVYYLPSSKTLVNLEVTN